jgi:hypothetical protein
MPSEYLTTDQAAEQMIKEAESKARDKTRYGIYRHAEVEAWTNAENMRKDDPSVAAQWAAIASYIAAKYHDVKWAHHDAA